MTPGAPTPDRGGFAGTPGPTAQADAGAAVLAALGMVLRVDSAALRPDTPLEPLGWDSLARVCLEDALAPAGWALSPRLASTSATIGDLVDACRRLDRGRWGGAA